MKVAALGVGIFMTGFVYASAGASQQSSGAHHPNELANDRDQVLCSYLLYGVKNFVCGKPPMADVKKKCEEKGAREHGEKIECACTDDPNYIRDTCD